MDHLGSKSISQDQDKSFPPEQESLSLGSELTIPESNPVPWQLKRGTFAIRGGTPESQLKSPESESGSPEPESKVSESKS